MPNFPNKSLSDFSLPPGERRLRQEVIEAMQTVQSALSLLSKRQEAFAADLKSHKVIVSSEKSMKTIQTYIEQSFTPSN
jgi:hypothetical protein